MTIDVPQPVRRFERRPEVVRQLLREHALVLFTRNRQQTLRARRRQGRRALATAGCAEDERAALLNAGDVRPRGFQEKRDDEVTVKITVYLVYPRESGASWARVWLAQLSPRHFNVAQIEGVLAPRTLHAGPLRNWEPVGMVAGRVARVLSVVNKPSGQQALDNYEPQAQSRATALTAGPVGERRMSLESGSWTAFRARSVRDLSWEHSANDALRGIVPASG